MSQQQSDLVLGVVLAGGQSRRMGGPDKALLQLGGRSLLANALDRLAPQVDVLAVSASRAYQDADARSVPVIPDSMAGYEGPLVGLASTMQWAVDDPRDFAWLACIAADTPLFPEDFVSTLQESADAHARAMVATSAGRKHPTCGLFHVRLLPGLQQFLQAGHRKMGQWLDEVDAVSVPFDDRPGDPFANINTPEDLAALESKLP